MATYAVEQHREDPDSEELKSLGTRAELRAALLPFNTSAETESAAEEELYGPGIRVTLPPYDPSDESGPITQFSLFEDDEDISKGVLLRIARSFDWDLIDLSTFRRLHMYRPPEGDDDSD
ncbi:MAG: hypothetical protein CMJ34_00450 [Phycisphaerae bacterium]|nr:hypothetical protein [Phycisphaerae bacterium]|tara:strand:+ start:158 stop:517 length:360 start_codon:yes stop_codon:yes gene_type:complete